MNHTPGPWEYFERDDGLFGVDIPNGHAVCYDMEGSCSECFGNMRLISAAPDMLSALEAVLLEDSGLACIEQVRDAIRKAKGEA